MGETAQQIKSHIDHERKALRSNLEDLEGKVRSVTDWRQYVRSSPAAMMAAAFAAGLLAAKVMGRQHGRADAGRDARIFRARVR